MSLRIRVHAPLGHYPRQSVESDWGRLIVSDDIIFSAVEVCPQDTHGIDAHHFSALEFLSLEEMRFFAAISLSVRPDMGMLWLYPWPYSSEVNAELADNDALRDAAQKHARETSKRRQSEISLPPLTGGGAYKHHHIQFDHELFTKIAASISLKDYLLMRGLGSLMRADMLWQRREFYEAAAIMLYVALDASFQMVRRKLIDCGIPNPSSIDAGRFIGDALGSSAIGGETGYFPEYYEDRIKAIHPANRYGDFPFPPLLTDDFYFLRHGLVEVFAYLVAEHTWPGVFR